MYTFFFIFQDHHQKLYSWLQFVKIKVSVAMFCQHHPSLSKLLGLQGWNLMVLLCSSVAFHFQQSPKSLTSFHLWLTAIQKPVLFTHNCRKFDSIILCNAITKCNFYLLSKSISGFCDTLPMSKKHISTRTASFSLDTLVRNILGFTYYAHNAVEDCEYLQKLIEPSSICIDAYFWITVSQLERSGKNL